MPVRMCRPYVNVEGYVETLAAGRNDFNRFANAAVEALLVEVLHCIKVDSGLSTIANLGTGIGEPAESEQNDFLRIDMAALNEAAQRASAIVSMPLYCGIRSGCPSNHTTPTFLL